MAFIARFIYGTDLTAFGARVDAGSMRETEIANPPQKTIFLVEKRGHNVDGETVLLEACWP